MLGAYCRVQGYNIIQNFEMYTAFQLVSSSIISGFWRGREEWHDYIIKTLVSRY